jgi:hypothetical protein
MMRSGRIVSRLVHRIGTYPRADFRGSRYDLVISVLALRLFESVFQREQSDETRQGERVPYMPAPGWIDPILYQGSSTQY